MSDSAKTAAADLARRLKMHPPSYAHSAQVLIELWLADHDAALAAAVREQWLEHIPNDYFNRCSCGWKPTLSDSGFKAVPYSDQWKGHIRALPLPDADRRDERPKFDLSDAGGPTPSEQRGLEPSASSAELIRRRDERIRLEAQKAILDDCRLHRYVDCIQDACETCAMRAELEAALRTHAAE